tara:strand:+ start:315 stop:530 length:216 start_codon:yes stop_codon:yes gene_type:complete
MSLTIIFITLIICTAIILFYIYYKTTDLFDKSEIETTALGNGIGVALENMEKKIDERINKLEKLLDKKTAE